MARPNKCRQVCNMPVNAGFGPVRLDRNLKEEPVMLTVDEYEVLRLIDYEGLNQEECSNQMNVARSTVQRVYNIARKKLITMLVEGRDIHISGGNYSVCDEPDKLNGCRRCRRQHGRNNDHNNSRNNV